MLSRSRSFSPLLLLCALLMLGGPTGCSHKPRESWWQFWRPKKAPTRDMQYRADSLGGTGAPEAMMLDTSGTGADLLSAGGSGGLEGADVPPLITFDSSNPLGGADGLGYAATGAIGADATLAGELQTIYFAYDSFQLDDVTKKTLEANARWMLDNPGADVLIEGHCDERGTLEYNMNLGQHRSNSVKAFLISMGVPEASLHTISYGEERPIDLGMTEDAHSRNRRAQFLVYQESY